MQFGIETRRVFTREDAYEWTALLLSTKLTASSKVVGVALRSRLNFKTGLLNPSINRLADDTCQSIRVVDRGIRALHEAGLIECSGRGIVSNRYRLTFPTATTSMARL